MTTLTEFAQRIEQTAEHHRERALPTDELRALVHETGSALEALAELWEVVATHVPDEDEELSEGLEGIAHGCRSAAALATYVGLGLQG